MTEDGERQGDVQESPDGPVESLTTFAYVEQWLREQQGLYEGAEGLLNVWCRDHPVYIHHEDSRGKLVSSHSEPVRLDDGGFITVAAEERVQQDGERETTVKITRLPYRALSWREARELAQRILRYGPKECTSVWCQQALRDLCDLLGHDSAGHGLGTKLYRAGVRTAEDLKGYSDERLLSLYQVGVGALDLIHERTDHCEWWGRLTALQRRTLAQQIHNGTREWDDPEEDAR